MSDANPQRKGLPQETRPRSPARPKKSTRLFADGGHRIQASLSAGAPKDVFSDSMMLTLQELAGNDAVTNLVMQRAPVVTARPAASATGQRASFERFLTVIQDLAVAGLDEHGKGLHDVPFGTELSGDQHDALVGLRSSLELASTGSPAKQGTAISIWQKTRPQLWGIMRRASKLLKGQKVDATWHLLSLVEDYVVYHEAPGSYYDFLKAIADLAEKGSAPHGKGLNDVEFGSDLGKKQIDVLSSMRKALYMTHQDGEHRAALHQWDKTQGDIRPIVARAGDSKLIDPKSMEATAKNLNAIDRLLRAQAVREAEFEGRAQTNLEAPDLASQEAALKQEEYELEKAKSMMEDAGKLASQGLSQVVLKDPGLGKDIFELATLPGTIKEKLEWAKNRGILDQSATAVELVSKVAGLKNTVIQTTFEFLKGRAERELKEALTKGLVKEAENWESLVKDYEKTVKGLKTLGKAFAWMGVAADAMKALSAALRGEWSEALSYAGKAAVGALGVLAEAGAFGLLAVITVTAQAEVEAIHLAAEFIRWCQDQLVRDAAKNFIDRCVNAAHYPAPQLLGALTAFGDPNNADIQQDLWKRISGEYAPAMKKHFMGMASELDNKGKAHLGAHPEIVYALGHKALAAFEDPFSLDEGYQSELTFAQHLAEMVRDVFTGANSLGKYVADHYPTKADTKKPD
jgi:hypothetical protein